MIIEQHIPAPKGYLSARVVMFRGDPAEEADMPEDRIIGARPEPAWDRFVAHLFALDGPFTSADIPGFTVNRASRYMTRAMERKVIRRLPDKVQGKGGRPKFVYEVAR